MKKPNDIILRAVTNVAVVIILTFAVYLFLLDITIQEADLLEG